MSELRRKCSMNGYDGTRSADDDIITLHVADNSIGADGATAIADALFDNTTLTSPDMSCECSRATLPPVH